jgi:hypothetical protein
LSCRDKKLFEKKFRIGDLEISCYQISSITSVQDHVHVTKDGETEHILNIGCRDIDTIFLKKDTLVIKTVRWPGMYEKKNKVFNYFLKIDSIPAIVNDTIYGYPIAK